ISEAVLDKGIELRRISERCVQNYLSSVRHGATVRCLSGHGNHLAPLPPVRPTGPAHSLGSQRPPAKIDPQVPLAAPRLECDAVGATCLLPEECGQSSHAQTRLAFCTDPF